MDRDKLVCIRRSLIMFNVVFLIFGLMITFFSIIGLKIDENLLKQFFVFSPQISTIRRNFSITGLLILVNAIFGLTAIFKKRLSFIIAFCFILIGLFVFTLLTIIYGIVSYVNLNNQNIMTADFKFSPLISQYEWKDSSDHSTKLLDTIQIEFQCCGSINGSKSWESFRPYEIPLGAYPLSCCRKDETQQLMYKWCSEQDVENRETCPESATKIVIKLIKYLKIIIGITSEALIVQLLCIICILMLRSQPMDRTINNQINDYL